VARAAGTVGIALLVVPLSVDELVLRNASRSRQMPAAALADMVAEHALITSEMLRGEGFSAVYLWDDDSRIRVG
jgi:predicted kinase